MASQIWAALSDWELDAELDGDKTRLIQAAFESLNQSQLIYRGEQGERNLYFYTRDVARHPRSLKAHVRRIYTATALGQREELVGALMDVFWILRDKGPSLRRRLFEQVEGMLPKRARIVLQEVAESGEYKKLLTLPVDKTVLVNGQFSVTV